MLAEQAGKLIGVGSSAVAVWDIAKWPDPRRRHGDVRDPLLGGAEREAPARSSVSPGGVAGVIIWILASGAFALYVANFASSSRATRAR